MLYPVAEPHDAGLLEVGDGNRVRWQVCGNPAGKPALFVHGGPGSGAQPWATRRFDPARYRLVLFDQRGCGGSLPSAAYPATDLRHNTTAQLVADMERLRVHLGIDRWLLHGVSWGSTLLLAYAERHPERVSEIVVSAVTTTRRSEIDWLYRGAGRFFPEAWQRFAAGAGLPGPPPDRETAVTAALLAGYARLTAHPDPATRERATAAWCAWEDTVLSAEVPDGAPAPYAGRPGPARLALVRLCAHYFSHGAWLDEGALIRDAARLAGIPGVIVQGRLDLGGPPDTAWRLARAWPGAELVMVEGGGHLANEATLGHVIAALDRFART
jgi:proline iminopeptidase